MGAMGCDTHTPIVCLGVHLGRQRRPRFGRSVGALAAQLKQSPVSLSLPPVQLSLSAATRFLLFLPFSLSSFISVGAAAVIACTIKAV